jgi:hypothetical protein
MVPIVSPSFKSLILNLLFNVGSCACILAKKCAHCKRDIGFVLKKGLLVMFICIKY